MTIVRTRAELAAARAAARAPVGAVLTMGALHAGHEALIRTARERVGPGGSVLVSVFVNPLQFGPREDLARYPRSLDTDVALARATGADVVWAPSVADVYPDGPPQVAVSPGPLGSELEGAARPTHFAGVLTVVAKLLGLLQPDLTAFGEKDYQQLVLVRRMAHDLELGIEVLGVPTVRETDGLALSSRTAYLDPAARLVAPVLAGALRAGTAVGAQGPAAVLAAADAVLRAEPAVDVDYLALRDPDLGPAPTSGPSRLLVAARVGGVRLLDNVGLHVGPSHAEPGPGG